jgi:hypothetical protein
MITYQLKHLALLNVFEYGLTNAESESLVSCIRENRDLVTLHLVNSSETMQLASSISRVFFDRALYLRLVVWNRTGEEVLEVSHGGVVLESRAYSTEIELIKNYLPQFRSSHFLE